MNHTLFRRLFFSFLCTLSLYAAAESADPPLLGGNIFAQAEADNLFAGNVDAESAGKIIEARIAAQPDDPAAHYERYLLSNRLGETQAAADALHQAAVKGDSRAQYELGMGYLRGENGIVHNEVQAVAWLKLAANAGLREAQYNLGVLYEFGLVGLSDIALAERYYLLAAEQGDAQSQYRLGRLYANKEGIAYHPQKAEQWLTLAAAQNHEAAKALLKDLAQ